MTSASTMGMGADYIRILFANFSINVLKKSKGIRHIGFVNASELALGYALSCQLMAIVHQVAAAARFGSEQGFSRCSWVVAVPC